MAFSLIPLRFTFIAQDRIFFPAGKSGNILRGAFGIIFREVASPKVYWQIFEPAPRGGPSGFADSPRPFVFRALHLDGKTIAPGERFYLDMHLFRTADPPLREIIAAFEQIAMAGLGPGRGRAELVDFPRAPETLEISLTAADKPVQAVRVRYLTPTELKTQHEVSETAEFPVLFSRARDRIATLRALYGAGPLDIDFRGLGERSEMVTTTRCEIRWVNVERRSSRTGQTHPLGGFVGVAEYEGDLAEFLPYLQAAEWTGIGRHTVWGKGQIVCEEMDSQ